MSRLEDVKEYIEHNGLNIKNRSPSLVAQKQYLCAYMKHKYNMTYNEIKELFNYGTHVTAMHGLKKHNTMMEVSDTVYLLATREVAELFPFGDSYLEMNMMFVYNIKLTLKEKNVLDEFSGGFTITDMITDIVKDKIESLKPTET